MTVERDDRAPATYLVGGSEPQLLACIANELAELRRLTAERNELLRDSNAMARMGVEDYKNRTDDARRLADAFDRAAELEGRVTRIEDAIAGVAGGRK